MTLQLRAKKLAMWTYVLIIRGTFNALLVKEMWLSQQAKLKKLFVTIGFELKNNRLTNKLGAVRCASADRATTSASWKAAFFFKKRALDNESRRSMIGGLADQHQPLVSD